MRSLLVLTLFAASSATAGVTVTFVAPEKFTDVRDRQFASKPDKNPHLAAIRRYTEKRAKRYLTKGQSLEIRFLDIDLAGDLRPQFHPELVDVRIVKSIYPPRMTFEYELKDDAGVVIKNERVELKDIGFDMNRTGLGNDALRFEKRMLDQWLRHNLP